MGQKAESMKTAADRANHKIQTKLKRDLFCHDNAEHV